MPIEIKELIYRSAVDSGKTDAFVFTKSAPQGEIAPDDGVFGGYVAGEPDIGGGAMTVPDAPVQCADGYTATDDLW